MVLGGVQFFMGEVTRLLSPFGLLGPSSSQKWRTLELILQNGPAFSQAIQGHLAYKKVTPLGPYRRPMSRVLGSS